MGRLDGKVVILTGAGNGQGAAEARLLTDEGAKVIATDIDEAGVTRVVAEIEAKEPGRAIALKHDVSNREDWERVLSEGEKAFGTVTVLVNNAGVLSPTSYDNVTYEIWTKIMNVNAWGAFLGMQTVIPSMKKAGVGSIVNLASIAAVNSAGGFSAYTASKGAVLSVSRSAAIELAPFNIRVNSVNPGTIKTQMVTDAYPDEASMKAANDAQPLKRMGTPEDVAYLVAYLASDESYFTTGSTVMIDGGASIDGSGMTTVLR
jgi:NAD(P)-dependent dehydrogenase (short-subunit alcohol dehydrogenase family)